MRGLASRRRSIRRKRALALPPDDGLVPVQMTQQTPFGLRRWFELQPPEKVHQTFKRRLGEHDRRCDEERWGGNQWGEEWVEVPRTRPLYARDMPLVATDLDFEAWCRDRS